MDIVLKDKDIFRFINYILFSMILNVNAKY